MSRSPDAPPRAAPAATGATSLAARLEARAPRALAWALAALLVVLLAYLTLGPKPWDLPHGAGFFAHSAERDLREIVMLGMWWAALVNALLSSLLLGTLRWWARPLPAADLPGPDAPRAAARRRRSWLFPLAVLAAMVLALGLRLPLATKSLWWDEGWTVRQVVVGWHYIPSGGTLADEYFREGGLARSLWYWRKPTNHVFYSVASWTSLAGWRAVSGADSREFDELAYRAPSVAAAVLSVLASALLLKSFGLPRAALFGAFLLALHPWHIRYGVDGRAYSLVVLFTLLAALGLSRWLRSGGWHHLALLAGSVLFMMWTYTYAAFVTAGLAGTGFLAVLLDGSRSAEARRLLAGRLVMAHVLVTMALFQLMAPNLTQAALWDYSGGVTQHHLTELWSGLAVGMLPTGDAASFAEGIPNLALLAGERPWLRPLVFGAMPLLVAVGFARLCLLGRAPAAALLGAAAAAPLGLAATQALDQQFYARFLSFLLPLVVLCLAAACDLVVRPVARTGAPGRAAAGLVLAALLVGYQAVVWPQTRVLLSHPYGAMRDVVEFMDALVPRERSLRVGLGLGGGMPRIYDPTIRHVERAERLASLCHRALAKEREFLVFYGYPQRNARRYDAVAVVEDRELFEPVGRLLAIETDFGYRVFRLRDGRCPPLPVDPLTGAARELGEEEDDGEEEGDG